MVLRVAAVLMVGVCGQICACATPQPIWRCVPDWMGVLRLPCKIITENPSTLLAAAPATEETPNRNNSNEYAQRIKLFTV